MSRAPSTAGVGSFIQDLAIVAMNQKAAVLSVPLTDQNSLDLLEVVEMERTAESKGTAPDSIHKNAKSMLAELPY